MRNEFTGAAAFLALLRDEGVTHLFGNPGTTELPIMDAMPQFTEDMSYILGLQESLVVAMADGYTRASGRLAACNVHVAPGLGNAIGAIYNARFTRTPMIITAGQQETGHGLTEPLLYDPLVPIAAPVVKWATEVTRLEDLPRMMRRAGKVAMTAPTGPVFISLPGDVLNDRKGIDLGARTRVNTVTRPSDTGLEALADRLLTAERPAILAGNEVVTSDALDEVARFAEVLGAPAFQQTTAYGSFFPSEHPAFMGALSRNQKEVRRILEKYDLLVAVGADVLRMSVMSQTEPLPDGMPIVQIGLLDWEMGKNYPADLAVRSDVRETLEVLNPMIEARTGHAETAKARLAEVAEINWSAKRARRAAELSSESEATPIRSDWLMLTIADALPEGTITVNEGLTTSWNLLQFLPLRDRYDFHSFASGGIGWALPASVGVQIAQPDRPVVALVGDGSAMYSIQALWTAAHLRVPVTFVILNNQGYRIIKQRLKAFHGNETYIGMDFEDPPIDFVTMAQSMGVSAERVTEPGAVRTALKAANENPGPNLIDICVERGV
ncbi:MAG: benzoylformate decarboxylase [Alphaproteobacteria bacterium]|nr:benzoylformate decarboxylase [Alphaproteobacteria bacterium]HCP01172.1 benzoylformate decarboxylase [Rhodospirillaceae bacterium]